MGRGATKRGGGGGGGASQVLLLQKEGGGQGKVLAIVKGGHKKFWSSCSCS